jgi:hypothetical protein
VFTARYALSPYIKQIRFVFKGLSRAGHCYTGRYGHFIKDPVATSIARLDISKFLSFGLPEGQSIQGKTSHHTSLDRHQTGDSPHWERCSAANSRQHATSCSNVSSGRWRPFTSLHAKSSSSEWIPVCVTAFPFHSAHALINYGSGVLCESPCIKVEIFFTVFITRSHSHLTGIQYACTRTHTHTSVHTFVLTQPTYIHTHTRPYIDLVRIQITKWDFRVHSSTSLYYANTKSEFK